jgi:hypothetical protein
VGLSASCVADWRTVFGKNSCFEEKCKPIIICNADGALHFIFPGTFTRRLSGGLARLGRGLPASGVAY